VTFKHLSLLLLSSLFKAEHPVTKQQGTMFFTGTVQESTGLAISDSYVDSSGVPVVRYTMWHRANINTGVIALISSTTVQKDELVLSIKTMFKPDQRYATK